MDALEERLAGFRDAHGIKGKGQLAVMLHITRLAKEKGLPIDPENLRTPKEGQVAGLGKGRVQGILKEHGISRVLAEEGGRTSRGSLGNAADYSEFLNALHDEALGGEPVDLDSVENWWIARVRDFFNARPFVLKFDRSKSLHSIVSDLIEQALKRQKECPGVTYCGTVLQHLVGAKLDLILPPEKRAKHYGANVADGPTARAGDFVVDKVAIHVTTSPSEALIRKCKANIEAGLRPVVVTIAESRPGVDSIAKGLGVADRIDVLEAEQFIAGNILEWSKFSEDNASGELTRLIKRYNEIIEEVETDPSLRIAI